MKTSIKSIAVAALALLSTTQLIKAQDEKKPEGGRPGGPGARGNFTPEERLKRMTETLGLTQEQQDKIKAIYAKNADAMKALREKGRENLTDEDRKKMMETFKAQQDEINAVLTEEQKTKMKEQIGRRGGPGGPGGERRGPGGDKKPEGEDKK